MRANDISELLASKALDIAQYLYPAGIKRGDEFCIGSIEGETGNSLKIHLFGFKAGIWKDFATGEGGDLLDLFALREGQGLAYGIKKAKEYLGIKDSHEINPAKALSGKEGKTYKKPDISKLFAIIDLKNAFDYLINARKLSPNILCNFQIKYYNNQIAFPYFENGNIIFIKYLKLERPDGKKQMFVESDCKPILFGWQNLTGEERIITICEGEIDAMTLSQMGIPALSVPLGAGTGSKHDWITHEFDKLSHYDKIYICMDNDDAGKVAAKEIAERLGYYRCPIVELPFKDANECLQNGLSYADMEYFFEIALTIDPEELKKASLYRELTKEVFTPRVGEFVGYEPLWEHFRGKVLFRPNELSIWTGINGHGKSQFLGELIVQLITQNAKVCIASMEIKPERLLARMCRQATAMREPSSEYLDAVFDAWEGNLWLFELVGTAKSKRLLEVFSYARQRYGVDVFVIDSFLTLDIAEDDYKAQKEFIENLRDFKNTHNCQIHMVMHPRKSSDESIVPNKLDIKGTGALGDLADNCFTIWRDKVKEMLINKANLGQVLTEKEAERINFSDGLWRCDKQRHGEWEGVIRLWFDKDSLRYMDSEGKKPKPYVEWSKLDDASNTHG